MILSLGLGTQQLFSYPLKLLFPINHGHHDLPLIHYSGSFVSPSTSTQLVKIPDGIPSYTWLSYLMVNKDL
jgi:hypothetical protein